MHARREFVTGDASVERRLLRPLALVHRVELRQQFAFGFRDVRGALGVGLEVQYRRTGGAEPRALELRRQKQRDKRATVGQKRKIAAELHEIPERAIAIDHDGATVEMVQSDSPCIIRLAGQKLCLRADELVSVLVERGVVN